MAKPHGAKSLATVKTEDLQRLIAHFKPKTLVVGARWLNSLLNPPAEITAIPKALAPYGK